MTSLVALCVWILSVVAAAAAAADAAIGVGSWENTHYMRSIDLAKGYVKETAIVEIKNTGSTPQNTYDFTLNDGVGAVTQLSAFVATLVDQLVVVDSERVANAYRLTLPAPVSPGSTLEVKVRYVYISGYEPLPAAIAMDGVQQLLLTLNKFPYSPYATAEYSMVFSGVSKGQEMELLGANATATAAPEMTPRVDGKSLVYGPTMETVAPFTVVPMGLLYEHNRPLSRVLHLDRSVWVPASPSAKVSVEEYYELTNTGAALSSGFSRVDWMKGRYQATKNHFALSQLELKLPGGNPQGIYYTDKVGQVDTSKEYQGYLVLQPRFPLFGGWHYNFTVGWYADAGDSVHKVDAAPDTYIVRFPLLSTIQDITYEDVVVNFYLPEGAEFVGVSSAVDYTSLEVSHAKSYLDVSAGHVKVSLRFENLIDDLSKVDLFVQYRYPAARYWWKVAKIAGFVFTALASYHVLSLIDVGLK
ncbi:Dolichyl-diphosphooligosaccharide--protein glycosyltransferase subunit 1 [[Candida] zeylanoides]